MNIKPFAAIAALGLAAFATPGLATPVTLTFEGANSFGFIDNFYNGGTDIPGVEPSGVPASGTNYNILFGADAMALANDGMGPGPNGEYFSNASSATILAPVGSSASMYATHGVSFIDSLSFSYSSNQAFTVDVLDAGDNVLGSLNLAATNGSCGESPYCVWSQATLNFSGAGKTVRFGGGYDALAGMTVAAFDDIVVSEVPVPAAGWLFASGLAALGRMRRKRAA